MQQVDLLSGTYKVISEADRALSTLDALVAHLPNPDILVQPSLAREAVSTSALKGTYAPYADVLETQYAVGKELTANLREIHNYVRAADRGLALIKEKPICLNVVAELQGILVSGTRAMPTQEMPSLVKVALSHYQFETLHPFSDGNGRIGRLAITLQLMEERLLSHPVLNLSPWLEPRREDYINHLLQVSRTGNFDPWVNFFAQAVRARSRATTIIIDNLVSFSNEVTEKMKLAGDRSPTLANLATNLIGYPLMTVAGVAKDLGVSYPTANKAVAKLVEAGYLHEITGRRYGRAFMCNRVFGLLSER